MATEATQTFPRPRAASASRWQAPPLRTLQVVLGFIWLLDGALQYQSFMFHKTFVTQIIEPNSVGQPGIIAHPILWMGHLVEPRVAIFNGFAATIEVLIGLGLIYRPTVRTALLTSFAWAGGIWLFGEGLGGLATGNAAPLTGAPGAALLYVIIGLILWPRSNSQTTGLNGGLLGVRGARIAWAALWLLAAGLWLVPVNRGASATHDAIAEAPSGAAWLTSIEHSGAKAAAGGGVAIAMVLALASLAIAIAVALDWHPRPFLAAACCISVAYWVGGEGLGGIFTGSGTDPGAGPLFLLLAATLYGILGTPVEAPPQYVRTSLVERPPLQYRSRAYLDRNHNHAPSGARGG
ncbi:MAG TPA: hypothetical protein VGL57_04875 [Solirubrobacteraceae bacterium]